MKNTTNTVILVSAGTIPGERSRQLAQSELYARCLDDLGGTAVYDGGCGCVRLLAERCDGLILSGGGDLHPAFYGQTLNTPDIRVDRQRDEREWLLLQAFCERKKPVLGICRGIQLIDVFFGGTLFRHLGTAQIHDTTIHTVVTSEQGRLRSLFGGKFPVNSYHHQAIRTLGAGLRVTAVSDADGVIEAVEHETLPVAAVQWHPERMVRGICADTETDMKPLFAAFLGKEI